MDPHQSPSQPPLFDSTQNEAIPSPTLSTTQYNLSHVGSQFYDQDHAESYTNPSYEAGQISIETQPRPHSVLTNPELQARIDYAYMYGYSVNSEPRSTEETYARDPTFDCTTELQTRIAPEVSIYEESTIAKSETGAQQYNPTRAEADLQTQIDYAYICGHPSNAHRPPPQTPYNAETYQVSLRVPTEADIQMEIYYSSVNGYGCDSADINAYTKGEDKSS